MADLPRINPSNVNYLAFEGGGGKGIVYLGVIKALEEIYALKNAGLAQPATEVGSIDLPPAEVNGARKLIYPTLTLDKRQIKGIAGTSAGAITAFSLAIGMSSEDLEYEANRTELMHLGPGLIPQNFSRPVNVYEQFFDDPSDEHRAVDPESRIDKFSTHNIWWNVLIAAAALPPVGVSIAKLLGSYNPEDVVWERIVKTEVAGAPIRFFQYIHNLLFNRGVFSGKAARNYFIYLMKRYLLDRRRTYPKDRLSANISTTIAKNAEQITFFDLFNLTGVDLVIVGTNVSAHSGRYFSVGHTPDFPVVDAVSLSMSMPMLFKPLLVNTHVDAEHGEDDYIRSYNGLYVDGGMAQNFPLHAFDRLSPFQQRAGLAPTPRELLFNGEPVDPLIEVSTPRSSFEQPPPFCDCIAGFNLGRIHAYSYDRDDDFTPDQDGILSGFLGSLVDVALDHGSEAQIRTYAEQLATIRIDHGSITVADFTTPKVARLRNDEEKAQHIEELQANAEQTTLDRFSHA